MRQPLWLSLLNTSVMPTAVGMLGMMFTLDLLGWSHWYALPLFIPFWVFGFFAWNLLVAAVLALRPSLTEPVNSHPPCATCGRPLATQFAKQCLHCGAEWHHE